MSSGPGKKGLYELDEPPEFRSVPFFIQKLDPPVPVQPVTAHVEERILVYAESQLDHRNTGVAA
jgi:hypothetical protein